MLGSLCINGAEASGNPYEFEVTGISVRAANPADNAGPSTFYLGAHIVVECGYRWLGASPPASWTKDILMQFYHSPAPGYVNFSARQIQTAPPGVVLKANASYASYAKGTFEVSCSALKPSGGSEWKPTYAILAHAKTTIQVAQRPPLPGATPVPATPYPLGQRNPLFSPSDPDPLLRPSNARKPASTVTGQPQLPRPGNGETPKLPPAAPLVAPAPTRQAAPPLHTAPAPSRRVQPVPPSRAGETRRMTPNPAPNATGAPGAAPTGAVTPSPETVDRQ
jgi:hypothetical protein